MPIKVPVMKEASVFGKTLVRDVPFGALLERVTMGIVAIIMADLNILSTGKWRRRRVTYMLVNWLIGLSTCPTKDISFIIIGASLFRRTADVRSIQPLAMTESLFIASGFSCAIIAPGYATPILISVCLTPTQSPVIAPTWYKPSTDWKFPVVLSNWRTL